MATLAARLVAGFTNIEYRQTGSGVDYTSPAYSPNTLYQVDLKTGTAAGQGDILFAREFTIGTGANRVVDLISAAEFDFYNVALAGVSVVAIWISANPIDTTANANTTNVTVTTAITGILGGTTPSVVLKPGSSFFLSNTNTGGLATLTAGTADTITLTNAAGAAAKVQIAVICRSA